MRERDEYPKRGILLSTKSVSLTTSVASDGKYYVQHLCQHHYYLHHFHKEGATCVCFFVCMFPCVFLFKYENKEK